MRKQIALAAAALLMMSSMTGCFGNDDTVSSEATESSSETHTEESTITERTSEDRTEERDTNDNGIMGDIATDAGDIVSDVADGAENLVDDITGSDTTTTETTQPTT